MKKILALALFGLTAIMPITAIPVAAQTVADLPAAALTTVRGEIARAAGSQRVNIDP